MRKLSELNNEELLIVFRNSRTLQTQLMERAVENFFDYWEEILRSFEKCTLDYTISAESLYYNKVDINIDCIEEFITGMDKVLEEYCLFDEEKIKEYLELKRLYCLANTPWVEFMFKVNNISQNITQLMRDDYLYSGSIKNLEELFLEFYVQEMTEESNDNEYFVDEEYKIYKMQKLPKLLD